MNAQKPRLLGLDIGSRTVGVAVSDPLGWTAQPLEVIRFRSWETVEERLRELVRAYEVRRLVIGLPRRTDGTLGPKAQAIRRRAERLQEALGLPCDFWDERLTTVEAERLLIRGDVSRKRRKQVIDQTAAALVLQGYLDAHRERD